MRKLYPSLKASSALVLSLMLWVPATGVVADTEMRGMEPRFLGSPEQPNDGDNLGNHIAEQNIDLAGFRITGLADPSEQTDAVNVRFLQSAITAMRDNLGNHIATMTLNMSDNEIFNLSDPSTPSSAVNLRTLNDAVLTARDNLGNHIATQALDLANFRVMNVADPMSQLDAVNLKTLRDEIDAAPGDNLGNHIAAMDLNLLDFRIRNLNDPQEPQDSVNLRTLQDFIDDVLGEIPEPLTPGSGISIDGTVISVDATVVRTTGNQTIGGNKTFTGVTNFSGQRVTNVADPSNGTDAANMRWVQNQISTSISAIPPYTGGTGITVAGTVISFDQTWGDGRYALRSRQVIAGDGLSGGGNLQSNRTLAVDGTVVRTSGNQTIGGNKTFTGVSNFSGQRIVNIADPSEDMDAVNRRWALAQIASIPPAPIYTGGVGITMSGTVINFDTAWGDNRYVLNSRQIVAGTGLAGGGDLNANRTLSFDQTWGDARYALRSRTIGAGDGLSGGGSLASNRTLTVDGTVIRNFGDQLIDGVKTFADNLSMAENKIINLADPTNALDAVNLRTMSAAIAAATPAPIVGGDGIAVVGSIVSVNNTVVRTTGNQSIAGNKTFTGVANFSNQRITAVADPTAATDAANRRWVEAQIASVIGAIPTYTGGTGITVAGTIVSFDQAWGDGRYALRSRTITAGEGLTGGGNLQANRTMAFNTTWGDDRYANHVASGFSSSQTYDGWLGGIGDRAMTFAHSQGSRPSDAPMSTQASGIHIGNSWGRAQIVLPNTSNDIFFRTGTRENWDRVATQAWSEGQFALRARQVIAGDGLSGGGNLQANRTINVDGTVVRTSGDQAISGEKTFTDIMNMSNQRIAMVSDPAEGQDAVNLRTMTAAINAMTGGTGPILPVAAGDGIAVSGNVVSVNNTVVRTTGNQTIGGNKTFTGVANFSNQRVTAVADPTNATDAANRRWVEAQIAASSPNFTGGTGITVAGSVISFDQSWGDGRYALRSRTITAGTGLTGGGNLQSNRTLNFDTTWGDSRYVQRTLTLTAGAGLTGGGNLQANRSLAFDTTWGDARYALRSRTITAGDGLSGGGNLQANRTINVDGTVVRTSGNQSIGGNKSFTGATSFEVGPVNDRLFMLTRGSTQFNMHLGYQEFHIESTSAPNTYRSFGMSQEGHVGIGLRPDSSWRLRVGGDARIDGVAEIGGRLTLGAQATTATDAVRADRTLTAGSGLTGGGTLQADRTFAVDATVVRTTGNQSIAGNKTFTGIANFSNQRVTAVADPTTATDAANRRWVEAQISALSGAIPVYTGGTGISVSGTVINFDQSWGDGRYALRSRTITAGTGLTGGGNLQSNRTLNFDTTWGDARYALRSRTITAGDGLSGGGNLQANRTINVDGTVVRTSGNQTIAGNKSFTGATSFEVGNVGNRLFLLNRGSTQFNINLGYEEFHIESSSAPSIYSSFSLSQEGHVGIGRRPDSAWRLRVNGGTLIDGVAEIGGRLTLGAQATAATHAVRADRVITAGTGLTGGGTLQANRTINFDTTWGDARYALRSRTITAGDGLSGGGNLQANRTVSVDGTVIRTTGNQSLAGTKTFTGTLLVNDGTFRVQGTNDDSGGTSRIGRFDIRPAIAEGATRQAIITTAPLTATRTYTFPNASGTVALETRSISTGTGLTGGGNFQANRTISFDTGWGDARYALRSRTITAGTGLMGGGNLQANRTINFDTTWGDDRYTNHVTAGFSTSQTYDGTLGGIGNGAMTFGHSQGARPSDAPANAQASGIHIGNTWGRTQMVFPNATSNDIYFRTGSNNNWDQVATQAWSDGQYALRARTITAGDGLSGGGNLQANRTINVDGTVVRTTGNQSIDGTKTFTGSLRSSLITDDNGTNRTGTLILPGVVASGGNRSGTLATAALSGNRTWTLPNATGTIVLESRTITAGTGLNGGGNLQANRTIALDANQIRRNAGQTDQGVMAFNGTGRAQGQFYGGTTNPSHNTRLNYSGYLYATQFYSTAYFHFSDERLKERIEDLQREEFSDRLMQLRPVSYNWIETGDRSMGLIAQEVQKVYPDLVRDTGDGTLSVDYVQLISPMLAKIQELSGDVEAERARNAELTSIIGDMEERLMAIEALLRD